MEAYEKLPSVGESSFSCVYFCRHLATQVNYAVKKIRLHEGIYQTTLREISVLKAFTRRSPHENIVQ
jgi:serine/threonine protein kinase